MNLTVDDTGINRHPVKLPLMPIGTDIHFPLAPDDFCFTITGYDVQVNAKTGVAGEINVIAKISQRNKSECAKLKGYFEGTSEANRLEELLNTPTANFFPSKPWACYEQLATLRKVVVKTDWELIRFRLLGKKSLAELKEKLSGLGLTTEMKNLPPDPGKDVIA